MPIDAAEVVRRYEQLKSLRSTWESHWQEISDWVIPERGRFIGRPAGLQIGESPGRRRHEKIFDDTAGWALNQLSAGLQGMLTGPAIRWFQLKTTDDRLNDLDTVKRWLEAATDRLFSLFNSPRSNFAAQSHELYTDIGAFGTGVMLVDDQSRNGVRFHARHLGECHIAENAEGQIDTLYREYQITARQMVQFFGKSSPDEVQNMAESQPQRKFQVIHAVFPREDALGDARFALNKPFASVYISRNHTQKLRESGFDEFPYMVPRWSKLTGEVYGRSPTMTVLPSIKMVNEMRRVNIVAAQKIIDPALLVPSSGFMSPIRTTPAALIKYDALQPNSVNAVKPLLTGGQPGLGEDMIATIQQQIIRGFHVDWLNLREGPQMTATEVLQRRDERLRLLGPVVARMQAEFQGPLIERTLKILERRSRPAWRQGLDGLLPIPPDELMDAEIDVEYVTPIGQAQKSVSVESIARVVETVERMTPFDAALPAVVNAEATVREVADVFNAPMDMLRTPDEVAAVRRNEAQKQALQAEAAAGAEQASAARDFAQANKANAEARS